MLPMSMMGMFELECCLGLGLGLGLGLAAMPCAGSGERAAVVQAVGVAWWRGW